MPLRTVLPIVLTTVCWLPTVDAAQRVLDAELHHLRIEGEREWSEFPQRPESASLVLNFSAEKNAGEFALRLRQQDVKQRWQVLLNAMEIGRLPNDENDMVVYFPIPPGGLHDGANTLTIRQSGRQTPDDVRVGEITLLDRAMKEALNDGRVEVEVFDGDLNTHVPCRITVLDERSALASVSEVSGDHLAIRPGVVYSGNGRAAFGLPEGEYTIYAGRGFEWGLDAQRVTVARGKTKQLTLTIRREVATPLWVSCDTHVHTFTHSRHGDATIQERMITLAGEGIELPIATDHNLHIDYDSIARRMGVRRHFTPVVGNEVTTKIGHFNIFPVRPGARLPNHRLTEWGSIFESIFATPSVRAVILNHARDAHGGFRPFGPEHFNAAVGQNLDGWRLRANAMELINSGAIQTDPMRLCRDWMAMLNRGLLLTPVGSSDSHDVARHFVGQARTYIRCDDADPGNIDVDQAVDSFVRGRVNVSYGLLAEMEVNQKYGPGELASAEDKVQVAVRVLGPSWIAAQRVELYANGKLIRQAKIAGENIAGVKWSGQWTLDHLQHDVHLVAVARGPAVRALYWPMAKPYQPTSPDWQGEAIGSTGAVWVDADGDGRRSSAYDYAQRVVAASGGSLSELFAALAKYDEAVAAQAASLLQDQGVSLLSGEVTAELQKATPATQRGVQSFVEAWRLCEMAR